MEARKNKKRLSGMERFELRMGRGSSAPKAKRVYCAACTKHAGKERYHDQTIDCTRMVELRVKRGAACRWCGVAGCSCVPALAGACG
jgi:hypothetical protein